MCMYTIHFRFEGLDARKYMDRTTYYNKKIYIHV
jgi:hypothetical protein